MEVGDRVRIVREGRDDRGREYGRWTGMIVGKQGGNHAIVHIDGPEYEYRTVPMNDLIKIVGGDRGRR